MVCAKCEAKLPKLVVGDKWKGGAGSKQPGAPSSASGPMRGGKVGVPGKLGAAPAISRPCRLCKGNVHLAQAHYCQACAYKNGICAMCGTRVLDTTSYKMSSK